MGAIVVISVSAGDWAAVVANCMDGSTGRLVFPVMRRRFVAGVCWDSSSGVGGTHGSGMKEEPRDNG